MTPLCRHSWIFRALSVVGSICCISCGAKTGDEPTSLPLIDSGISIQTDAASERVDSGSGKSEDAAPPDIEPFATPSESTLACTGSFEQLAIKLPCKAGYNLVPGERALGAHAVECEVTKPAVGKLSLVVFLTDVPAFLHRPHDISDVVQPPEDLILNGKGYEVASLEGTITFSSVETRRAFVAQFEDLTIDWKGSSTCHGAKVPFWAIPGDFL